MEILLSQLELLWDKNPVFYVAFSALVVAVLNLLASSRTSKVKNSLDFETSYKHKEPIKKASDEVLKILKSTNSDAELIDKLFKIAILEGREDDNGNSAYLNINDFLNEWERCANGIYYGVYDEKFLYGTYAGTVTVAVTKLLPFILMRQGGNRERVYIKICWLALRWHIQRDKEKGTISHPKLVRAYSSLSLHHNRIYSKSYMHRCYAIINMITKQSTPKDLLLEARKSLIEYVFEKSNTLPNA
ncbi:DUF4760 domain-containing protein [Vibrio cholerae]|uniref:ORF10a n=1 Tax=Vibrio phage E8498 TaxID=213779 RepID=Q8HA56_9CAUD|nr:DUF4760 domain-containing protein [Vibrio cholerae]AAN74004.1 ORF10a [Vibrio phage E8498]EKF9473111.1 DUF4760 domain-containing protein [Vibrio cholerae]EKF9727259.1 DUF4760 domain-containing protein [Vibrio cholerae]HCF7777558.1 DUF4760 domain-containing protein [Vibrio cholerae]HCF7785258.1 DUF4760 domain-containing protein [Vibrio cholerae]